MKKVILLALLFVLITPTLALKETTIYLPAVEETKYGYEGALATLIVKVKEGKGQVYVDTWPLTKIDTQASARMGKQVACDLLYLDCSDYDFYYVIRSNARIVGGPSGGAAITIATLASLLDLDIDSKVMITGTINLDGTIGPVAGILEKAEAVAKKGDTFLVPYGQSIVQKEKITTKKIGPIAIEKKEPQEIDVKEYAKEHWNLTVKEVRTIKEAFKYFTNYEIKEPKIEFKKTEKYQQVMKKLADNLINRASKLKENCEEGLKLTTVSYEYQTQISEICGESLEKAKDNYEKGNYYSAASIAFSKAISYRYGSKLTEFLKNKDKYYLRDYLENLEEDIFEIDTKNMELYAIIEERLSEVRNKLEEGWKSYYNEDYIQGLNYAAFAEERLYTAQLWMKYADEFPSYIENESKYLREISRDMISEASSIITYTSISSSNSYIQKAEEFLDKAKENYEEGNYYTSIIYCLKSQANAELGSVFLFEDKDYLIKLHRKAALVKINKTNSVIGQSYFEYAQTLEEEDKDGALIYYIYAKRLSTLSEVLNKEPKETTIPKEHIQKVSCDYERVYIEVVIVGIALLVIGFVLGRKL